MEASEQSVFSNDSHPAFGVADESEARHAASSENEPLLSMRQSASQSTLENGGLICTGRVHVTNVLASCEALLGYPVT